MICNFPVPRHSHLASFSLSLFIDCDFLLLEQKTTTPSKSHIRTYKKLQYNKRKTKYACKLILKSITCKKIKEKYSPKK